MIKRIVLPLFLLALPPIASSMEIPLERGTEKNRKGGGPVIGFVDMDLIYQEFPETKKARQEYQAQAEKIKQALLEKDAELSDLREQLAVLQAAAGAGVARSTDTASNPPVDVQEQARNLQEQEAALLDAKKEAAADLLEYERMKASQIFGKLYRALMQLADEKGIDMVLDKSALLYGQGGMDLTDALSRRVRGLPDAAGDQK